MGRYYLKRALQSVFTFWAVLTITFALIKWMPGGPLDFLRAQFISGDVGVGGGAEVTGNVNDLDQFNDIALDYLNIRPGDPLHIQYWTWLSSTLSGDLGYSIAFNTPVEEVIIPAIPWTLFLGTIGLLISFVSRVVIGSLLAYREGSQLDFVGTTVLLWMHSIPFFLVALVLLYIASFQLGWFPIAGRINAQAEPGLNWPFVSGLLNHAALPVISLAWASFGAGAIAMRANSVQILGEDYLRVAKLRGIELRRLSTLYVARNAILPIYNQLLIQLGFIFAGSLFIEVIFQYKGIGFYLWRGIQARDTALMMAAFILITASVVLAMFIADVTYGVIDPRVKRDSEAY